MKRRLLLLLAALAAVASSVTIPADTASAHWVDNTAGFYCTLNKSDPGDHVWVNHAVYYSLQPGLVTFKCSQYDVTVFGHPEFRYFAVWHTPSGATWRQGGYDWCGDGCISPH